LSFAKALIAFKKSASIASSEAIVPFDNRAY
jgi:hypothetical protein